MSTHSSDGEVFGANVLTGAIIVGAVILLLGSITSPAPAPAQHVAKTPIEQVIVVAPKAA